MQQTFSRFQSVDDLSDAIKQAISQSPLLRNIAVKGEIQNFKRHTSGHVYFTLAGEETRISCIMFRSSASSVVSWPRDGDEVVITGRVDTYPKSSAYQIYVNRLMPVGAGAIARAREELRKKLEAEGIFDARSKRPIPRIPSKVAIVTSPTGAAVQDIINVSERRAPFIDITVIPALVQGVDAPESIVSALASVARVRADCVILARGGGSQDDLSVFDDERVVRAIRTCPVPVVTGVGHETDTTLVDFAADLRAPTPSAAAEIVFPDIGELHAELNGAMRHIQMSVAQTISSASDFVERRSTQIASMMESVLDAASSEIDDATSFIEREMEDMLDRSMDAVASYAARLDALSPLAVLSRGYVSLTDADERAVVSVDDVSEGDLITLRLHDGKIKAEVLSKTSA